MSDEEVLRKYAETKLLISGLEDKLEELKPQVIAIVDRLNPEDHEVATDFGKFSNVQKRKYTYTEVVEAKTEELKLLKKEEEAKGIAPYVIEPYLKFSNVTIE